MGRLTERISTAIGASGIHFIELAELIEIGAPVLQQCLRLSHPSDSPMMREETGNMAEICEAVFRGRAKT